MELVYRNNFGEVTMTGNSDGILRICAAEGLGPIIYDYNTVVFSGCDGQETVSRRALPRHITLSLEINMSKAAQDISKIFDVLQFSGTLYVMGNKMKTCINCNQTHIPEIKSVLRGEIATFAVQFVCDNPFFEAAEDTIVPLYERRKKLASPFSLPSVFSEIVLGGRVKVEGTENAEPVITVYYPGALSGAETLIIKNLSTGKQLQLDYAPEDRDTVVIDVKNRKVTSLLNGNIINYLTKDTFLGDFIFVPGLNVVDIMIGDMSAEFAVECKYNSLYREAVVI